MSFWGNNIALTVFGESHGSAVGFSLADFPAGIKTDDDIIEDMLSRRRSGGFLTTKRTEPDIPKIISGINNGITNGFPVCVLFENTDTKSADYHLNIPRPAHADLSAYLKYKGFADMRGGGHFSGRLTAPLVYAGALCKCALLNKEINVSSRIVSIGGVKVNTREDIEREVALAASNGDSVGAVVEVCAKNVTSGLGGPLFFGMEGKIAQAVFAIPGVCGIEFGLGFALSTMNASSANDEFYYKDNQVKLKSNNCGGVLGGITLGEDIIFRVAFKPTPSIYKKQQSVNLDTQTDCELKIKGRHDPCIALRGAVVCEAVMWLVLLDILRGQI